MSVLNPPEAAGITRSSPPDPLAHQGPWRPWHGRPRGRDVVCCLMIGVSAVYAIAMIPLALVAAAEPQGTRLARPAVLVSALMPVSGAPVYAAAGWVGLPLVTFVILDAIGCAAWATVLAICGYLLGAR
ncbi:MAG: hypothetical protein ACRDPO_35175, partial [Streptosporangiaceae bacterium]